MKKIKEPVVADMFYPKDPAALKKQIENFEKNINAKYKYYSRAVIVPHAGLVYSGNLAYQGISQLDTSVKNIFIFAPTHKSSFEGIALSGYDEWSTPFGNITINQDVNNELIEKYGAKIFDEAYTKEHSVEIEIPIIQHLFSNVSIIPVLIGKQTPELITKIIEEYYKKTDFGFIISSDLSHFLNDEEAKYVDNLTAEMIETGSIQKFTFEQACGAIGICGLVDFANKSDFSLIRVGMHNSSNTSGDKKRVVGYGSWMLFEGTKNQFIKKYFSSYIINLCRDIILSNFDKRKVFTNHLPVFNQYGACFVTLKQNGNLRGCIGSIVAHQPLIRDIVDHSCNAAFRDTRFKPLTEKEAKEITIDVSILSKPKRMTFESEEDLLSQLVPNKDGLIIKDGNYQAVYLPSVWEDLPEKKLFLNSLKKKAGLSPDHFSKTFEAYRFETELIEQD